MISLKRIISLMIALCLLTSCVYISEQSEQNKTPEGKPWINSNLLSNLPAPEDGFDMYANYDTYKEALDSGSMVTLTSLDEAEIVSQEQVLDLCRNMAAEYEEDEILKILYGLITDSEKRNADGMAPLMAKVDRVKAAETLDDLLALMQEEGFLPCDSIFTVRAQQASDDSGQVFISIARENVLEDKPLDQEAQVGINYELEKDTETPKALLMRMQYSEEEAGALVERMKEYDEYIPDELVEWPAGKVLTIEQLKEKSPLLYAQVAGMGMVKEGPIYEILLPELIEAANHFVTEEDLDLLKAIIALRLYKFSVSYLDEETWKAEGSWNEDYEPDRNVYHLIDDTCAIAMDQAYLKHFCPEENREMVVALYEELKDAMRNRIMQNDWMDEVTKKTALEKLELINVAPFTATGGMFDCGPLKMTLQSCTTLFDAAVACQLFKRQCTLRYAGKPYVRGSRYMAGGYRVMDSNGRYSPEQNIIFIGAPALNMPMFNTKSKATMLGTIGHHLGHELSHAFSVGALTDATGQGPLYTEETGKIFMEKVTAMVVRINQIEPLDGVMFNGSAKISELMPDVTGVSLSLDVAKKTENFDYKEFFLTYASFFRTSSPDRETLAKHAMSANPHPLPFIRVNYVVAQFEEFYEAFPEVREGTPMYITPEDRILIW